MKLPSVVKRIGESEEENQVYIEDYVYSYLSDLKKRADTLPLRAALFGYTCNKGDKTFYFIYGAACVTDEIEKGRSEEDIRNLFFEACELIGYVNVYGERLQSSEKSPGYCIFYDTNEPMQNYLLSCRQKEESRDVSAEEREELADVWRTGRKDSGFETAGLIKRLLSVFMIIVLAIAVTTIDEYEEMYGFVAAAERAVLVSNVQMKDLETDEW